MKRINQGLQFTVYDYTEDRVLKIPNSKLQIFFVILKWFPKYLLNPLRLIRTINHTVEERDATVNKIKEMNIPSYLFGNPEFKGNEIYQDKVKTIKEIIQNKNFEEQKLIVDKCIRFVFETWKYGFSERTYNFLINYGMDKKGKIILIDFGKISFKKKEVIEHINSKKWEKAWSFGQLDERLKNYYKNIMIKHMTKENLDRYWNIAKKRQI